MLEGDCNGLDSPSGEGIFRGEGGQGINSFSIFEVLHSRGAGGYAICCSSGRSKLSKSKGLKGENVSVSQ